MKWYYIRFTYDHWCQGYDEEQETLMVQAIDFDNACYLISKKYERARKFKDLTIRETDNL